MGETESRYVAALSESARARAAGDWELAVRALYLREPEMDVAEFERLLDVAMTGERPDDDRLPAYLPLGWESFHWESE